MGNFTYCMIPAEGGTDVSELTFTGETDQDLRDSLNAYFGEGSLTDGQKQEFTSNMHTQVEENSKKGHTGTSAPPVNDPNMTEKFIRQAMERGGGFEIVPVIYPDSSNGYKGMSLYIDQVGRFKDLPLNERASKMSQRDIRGDAFCIASYDDPIKDSWARIDCPMTSVEELIKTPPVAAQDPTARANAMQASMQTVPVTDEDAAKALEQKNKGNALFQQGKYAECLGAYGETIKLLSGRLDNVDEEKCTALLQTAFLNRAQAHLKLSSYKEAEEDCSAVLRADPLSVKAWYRRAMAKKSMKEYDASLEDLEYAQKHFPEEQSIVKLLEQVC